jgi:hypothetical protein
MVNRLQLGIDLVRRNDVTIRQVAKVKLHTRSDAPLKRHGINGDRWMPIVHVRTIVIGSIHMSPSVCADAKELNGPSLLTRKFLLSSIWGKLRQFVWLRLDDQHNLFAAEIQEGPI